MLLRSLCAAAVLAFLLGGLWAQDKKPPKDTHHRHHAKFVKAVTKGKTTTITFTVKDREGKVHQHTLPLADKAKILGEDNKPEALAKFVAHMSKDPDKHILIVEDREEKHIVAIRDLPDKPK